MQGQETVGQLSWPHNNNDSVQQGPDIPSGLAIQM
jgi:hypothetical protein